MKVLSVAELLREVGATAEAAYCDLMAKFRAISRGLDTEGNQVSGTPNLIQMEAAVQTLRDMRHACVEGLNQSSREPPRSAKWAGSGVRCKGPIAQPNQAGGGFL